jgi:DTW domain-containing protein YfiP
MTRDDDGDDDLAALWQATREASEDADDHPSISGRRASCEACDRPARACLCPHLPETPFPTRGALVVLTHPNEHKRALATGWILPRCLRRCAVLTRRSPPDAFLRMLRPAASAAAADDGVLPADAPIYLLYPALHATDVTRVDVRADAESFRSAREGHDDEHDVGGGGGGGGGGALPGRISAELTSAREALRDAAYLCIAVDSTWRQAREMVVRAVEALPARTRLVQLPTRGSAEAPGLRRVWERSGGDDPGDDRGDVGTLRVEPAEGCMLTAEAAARAMAALERGYARDGDGDSGGDAAAAATISALRAMARTQAAHDPAMRAGVVKRTGGRRQRIAAAERILPKTKTG